jgi:hypothetical protein
LWDFSKVPTSQYYHYSPSFLQNYHKISILLSFLFPTTKANHSFPPQEACGNKYSQNWIENYVRGRESSKDPSSPFKEKEKEGKSKAWWLMEGEGEGSHAWRSMEGEGEGFLLGGQWKEKEKVFCLVANGRRRRRFPCLVANGR